MEIANIKHKGLKKLVEDDDRSGFQPQIADKIMKIIAFLQDMTDILELQTVPTWKAHQLTGNRKGTWALHVTKNWRLTFIVNNDELEILDVDYEDYH